MLESSYNMSFGKMALKCLFEDYFDEGRDFTARMMLKSLDDPHVDLTLTVGGPFRHGRPGEDIVRFAFQCDVLDPHTFVDVRVSETKPYPHTFVDVRVSETKPILLKLCSFSPSMVLILSRDDDGFLGYRYDSSNLAVGATISAAPSIYGEEFPRNAWLVSKIGRLTAGVQYEPKYGSKGEERFEDPENWSYAVGYGVGSDSHPSFNVGLELLRLRF